MTLPKVSVVVPAYNAADTISGVLEALLVQTYQGPWEVIVVDDGSTDHTAERARAFFRVRYVYQDNAGPASARNRGAASSGGEIVLFTDSDCYPEPSWIEKMVSAFTHESIGVVAGSYGIANPGSPLACSIHEEILFRHRQLMPEYPRAFGSYNFAVRRAVFDKVGGFNTAYRYASGEDNDLSYKILAAGYKIRFRKDALVAHVHQPDLGKYLREQFRHGFWRLKMYQDHPRMAAGDDYTFWKDIVEVPWAAIHLVGVFWGWGRLVAVAFFIFEMAWGVQIMGRWRPGIFCGSVMWLRAFARTAGLLWGGIFFLKYTLIKDKKI